jgi:hypothetical protein
MWPNASVYSEGGSEYEVMSATKLKRRVIFVNTVKIETTEYLLFRPLRKVNKIKSPQS